MKPPRAFAEWLAAARKRLFRVLFGDRVGLVLFLGALAFSVLTWRIGFFITDNWTLANAFVSVADGQLHVGEIVYGEPHGATPGMHVVDGRLYARNYGQLVAALPLLWLLWGVSAVADPALALVATVSLLVLATFVQLGRLLDREPALTYAGIGVALAVFVLNAAVAVDLRPYWIPFAALQLSTMVAAGLTVVVLYRLLRRLYDRRIGAVGGAIAAFSSPVAFWATIPKRHALTALLVVLTLYWFVRSRDATERPRAIRLHALAYLPVGLLAWVHAAEALVLFGALAIADAMTLRRFDPPRLAIVAGVLFASLLPFLATNWLISGEPLTPPRLLPRYWGKETILLAANALNAGSSAFEPAVSVVSTVHPQSSIDSLPAVSTPTPGAEDGSTSLFGAVVAFVVGLVTTAAERVGRFLDYAGRSFEVARDGDRLYRIFVRSGHLEGVAGADAQRAVSLTVLESMPLLAGLVALPVVIVRGIARRLRERDGPFRGAVRREPTVAADVFVLCFTVLLLGLFLARLPVHVSWTVRYLHPLYPLGVYTLLRLAPVREVIERDGRLLAWSYAAVVLIGGQSLIVALAALEPTVSEAVQLHAVLSLAAAGAMAVWAVAYAAVGDRITGPNRRRFRRTGAVAGALAGGTTTTLLVLWALAYFPHSQFALPAVWELSRLLPFPA